MSYICGSNDIKLRTRMKLIFTGYCALYKISKVVMEVTSVEWPFVYVAIILQ